MQNPILLFFSYSIFKFSYNLQVNPDPVPPPIELNATNPSKLSQPSTNFLILSQQIFYKYFPTV